MAVYQQDPSETGRDRSRRVSDHLNLRMGMKKGEEPSDSVKKLKECVLEYVGELKKRKKP